MNDDLNTQLNQILDQLGIHQPGLQAASRAQIYKFTFERAVAELQVRNQLTDAEKTTVKEIFAAGNLGDPRLTGLFTTPERQQVLEAAFAEAIDVAFKSVKS